MNKENQDLTDPRKLRKKAEQLLKEKQQNNELRVIEADEKRLLHELQVHQIELEMQNEELRQANEEVEKALKKYTMLYDLAPMGYLTIERDGAISDLNFTAADMLGDRRFSLVNTNLKLFVSSDSLQVFNDFLNEVFTSEDKESCEVKLSHEENHSLDVYMEGIVTGDDQKCLLSIVDITSFRK